MKQAEALKIISESIDTIEEITGGKIILLSCLPSGTNKWTLELEARRLDEEEPSKEEPSTDETS